MGLALGMSSKKEFTELCCKQECVCKMELAL